MDSTYAEWQCLGSVKEELGPQNQFSTWIVYGDLLRIVTGDSSLLKPNIGGGFK